MHKSTVQNILLLVVTLIILLTSLEISSRTFFPQTTNFYQYDSDYLFSYRPGAEYMYVRPDINVKSVFNSEGLRDNERDYYKKSNKPRILFLGDSMVAGLEVKLNDTFVKLIETKLRGKFEVLSAGVSGWSTEQQLLFLEKKGLEYKPDVVILAYYVGNDQIDNVVRQIFTYDSKELSVNQKRPLSETRVRSLFYFFTSYSHAFNFFFWHLKDLFKQSETKYSDPFVEYIKNEDTKERDYSWNKTFALLDRMNEDLTAKNISFVLLTIPDRLQVDINLRKKAELKENELVLDKPQQKLINYATSRKIKYVDLLPPLKSNFSNSLYYKEDIHWLEPGHSLVAEEILKRLEILSS